jgi:hypothetical protein
MIAHLLLVHIKTRAGLAAEHALALELKKVFVGLGVDFVAVRIRLSGQVDLGTVDVQQTAWLAGGKRGSLSGVDHIVGHAGYFGRKSGLRNETLESANSHKAEMQAVGVRGVKQQVESPKETFSLIR